MVGDVDFVYQRVARRHEAQEVLKEKAAAVAATALLDRVDEEKGGAVVEGIAEAVHQPRSPGCGAEGGGVLEELLDDGRSALADIDDSQHFVLSLRWR